MFVRIRLEKRCFSSIPDTVDVDIILNLGFLGIDVEEINKRATPVCAGFLPVEENEEVRRLLLWR